MNISGMGSTTGVASIQPRSDNDADDVQQTTGVLPGATQTTVSPEGGMLGQLAQLALTNPDQFKQVAAEVSQKLKDEAGQAAGKATFLNNLADKFTQASQTGDLSSLKPSGAQGHHHGHRYHGGSGATAVGSGQRGFESLAQIIQQSMQDVTGASTSGGGSTGAPQAGQGSSSSA